MAGRIRVHVVPHTHWDREWYEPFEGYRFRLVKVLDRLLDVLTSDAGFRHFNMDGQTAAIDDYLEVRPDAEQRLARVVREGKLAIGPWRILMDEFLCSPETIVRNLQQAARTAARLGRRQAVGYIPDSFGHVAQMPQLLRLAGLSDACVWRGVPLAVDRALFRWVAPDGSSVRTAYLATSYSNAVGLPDDAEDLVERARRIAADLAPFAPGETVLAMNGSDHRGPEEHLPAVFEKANAMQDAYEIVIGSLEEYFARAGEPAIEWRGEMRSGARANLLMGVVSARMPLKQAEFAASITLERYAEPLQALAGTDTGALLDRAWRWMVENSAHDSICGCGIDEVADQVHARYGQAERIAELVAGDALDTLRSRADASWVAEVGALVFNPSPAPRDGIVELTLMGAPRRLALRDAHGALHPAQAVETRENVAYETTLSGRQLLRLVAATHVRAIGSLWINGVRIDDGTTPTVSLDLGPVQDPRFDVRKTRASVEAAVARRPRARWRVLGVGPPLVRALARVPVIGGLGWTVFEAVDAEAAVEQPARADGHVLDNGLLRVSVGADGSVTIERDGATYAGVLAMEDVGDAGDEYNYSPPARDVCVREPADAAVVETIEEGPLQATLRVRRSYRIPASLTADRRGRSRRTVSMPVVTDLTLRIGEPFLRVAITVRNAARDHRLRALVPLPFTATGTHADGAFHAAGRGLVAEGGSHEVGVPSYPSRRWVDVSDGTRGVAVFHRGTPEYEVTADGRMLAVTLLRCVGFLSHAGLAYRAGLAGPALETPGAQLEGTHRFELAVYPHAGDWRAGSVHTIAEAFTYPLRGVETRPNAGDLPPDARGLEIRPDAVRLSALHRDGGSLTCRVWNSADEPVEAQIALGPTLAGRRATKTDLLGAGGERLRLDGDTVLLPLRGHEIATLRLS